MTFNIRELTNQLEINDQNLKCLKEKIVKSFGDEIELRKLLSQQCLNQEETNCLSCDNEGDCKILNGVIYLALNEIKNAVTELEKANWYLRSKYEIWNGIIGLVLLGVAFEKHQNNHTSLRVYKKALNVLKSNYLRVHSNDYNQKTQLLEIELLNKIDKLDSISSKPSSAFPLEFELSDKLEKPLFSNSMDYLALFSIPVYGTVEAGLDGRLQVDHFNVFTIINQVELKKQIYDVYNIHGTAEADRQITITTKREHGWLCVHGLSMNGWDLPFDENDYILFYKSQTASHHDFVIASNTDPSGEIALMVKRFDAEKNQLVSKSKDKSKPYGPIPVDERHQIVGIVIAVAKPAE